MSTWTLKTNAGVFEYVNIYTLYTIIYIYIYCIIYTYTYTYVWWYIQCTFSLTNFDLISVGSKMLAASYLGFTSFKSHSLLKDMSLLSSLMDRGWYVVQEPGSLFEDAGEHTSQSFCLLVDIIYPSVWVTIRSISLVSSTYYSPAFFNKRAANHADGPRPVSAHHSFWTFPLWLSFDWATSVLVCNICPAMCP